MAGWLIRNSSAARMVALSTLRPASTQITIRSSASGRPRVSFILRADMRLLSQKLGAKIPESGRQRIHEERRVRVKLRHGGNQA